ncbi:MAG: hypothetical protein ACE366_16310 [Bradymonadia bacterium]
MPFPDTQHTFRWFGVLACALGMMACVDRGHRALDPDQIDESAVIGACLQIAPEVLDFGSVPHGERLTLTVTLQGCGEHTPTILDINVSGGDLFSLAADAKGDMVGSPVIGERTFDVTFHAATPGSYEAQLNIRTNHDEHGMYTIPMLAIAGRPDCPTPVIAPLPAKAPPLEILTLDGTESVGDDRSVVRWSWAVVERPENSSAQVVERYADFDRPADGGNADDQATPTARFFLDVAGRYTFELTVTDSEGLRSPSAECPVTARAEVEVVPTADLHLQMTWHTPLDDDETDDDGTDVDLYLLHPHAEGEWRAHTYACYYHQPSPVWGGPEADDDPTLDIDDVNGAGPENINLAQPEFTDPLGAPYQVGVHYYRSGSRDRTSTYGASEARLKIYIAGALVWDAEARLRRTDDFWDAARVHWDDDGGRVEVIDRVYDRLDNIMP